MGNTILRRDILHIPGHDVGVEWKNIKNMRLRYSERYRMFVASIPRSCSKEEAMKWLLSNLEWMNRTAEVCRKREQKYDELTEEVVREYYQNRMPKIFEDCQRLTGVYVRNVTLRRMSSRWGSARPSVKRVTLNSLLALFPDECTRYVVIHELMHFHEPNHSSRFWALVEKYCPDWRRWREMLNKKIPTDA